MAKVNKAVDLKHFTIQQVENGWAIEARKLKNMFDWRDSIGDLQQFVFNDLDELLEWIEANI